MEFSVSIEGASPESPRWILCPGRATVTLQIQWQPPPLTEEAIRDRAPTCTLTYLTTPGAFSGVWPPSVTLAQDPLTHLWEGKVALQALPFSPLRVRVELQPAFGRAHIGVLHVVPVGSAWVATGLVVASLVSVAILLMLTLATLRLTLTQAVTGIGGLGVLAAAGRALSRTVSTLKPGHLPYFGVPYLIPRAGIACGLGLLAVIAGLQSCVVVIHNDTPDELKLVLPWRDGEESIAPHARISVVPPDGRSFRGRVLEHLPDRARNWPLCIDDGSGRDGINACRGEESAPFPTLGTRLRGLFTPPTLVIRCGRWWVGLTPADTLESAVSGIRLTGDRVWLEPDQAATCQGDSKAMLWYEVDGAAHHVRYPWQPRDLDTYGRLSVDPAGEGNESAELTFVSVGAEADEVQETRISLAPGRPLERDGWPVAGLKDASRGELKLQIGDLLQRPSESFSFAAELGCSRSQARGTTFHATRIELLGPSGWLNQLVAASGQGAGWRSTWTLARSVGAQVGVPWICEALPGDRPQLTRRVGFATSQLDLFVDDSTEALDGEKTLLVPTYLMARTVSVNRQGTRSAKIGRVECQLDRPDHGRVGLVRVRLTDPSDRKIGDLAIAAQDQSIPVSRWIADASAGPGDAGGDAHPVVWFCWDRDAVHQREVELEIMPLHAGQPQPSIRGTWDVAAGTLKLRSRGPTVCYFNATLGLTRERPARAKLGKPMSAATYRNALPLAKGCEVVRQYTPLQKDEP